MVATATDQVGETGAGETRVLLGLPIHPDLHTDLKMRSVRERRFMTDLLHEILCRGLGREDLLKAGDHTRGS